MVARLVLYILLPIWIKTPSQELQSQAVEDDWLFMLRYYLTRRMHLVKFGFVNSFTNLLNLQDH